MPGRGPRPKDPSSRARRNKDPIPARVVSLPGHTPGQLPDDLLGDGEVWHPATLRWWNRWCASPLATDLPETDWCELEQLAVLKNQFHQGETKLAPEMRLRMAKFGATPEDRARLRIQVADADEKDAKRPAGKSARERYGGLRSVGD